MTYTCVPFIFQDVGRFVIPVFGVPIPGKISLKFQLGWSVEFSVSH